MLFTATITTAASTTTQYTNLKCSMGIIHQVEIHFPSGCNGLLSCSLYLGGHQILPSTEGMEIIGNKETIVLLEHIELNADQNTIRVQTTNADDTYSHTIQVRVSVLPQNVLVSNFSDLGDLIRSVLLKIFKSKEVPKNV